MYSASNVQQEGPSIGRCKARTATRAPQIELAPSREALVTAFAAGVASVTTSDAMFGWERALAGTKLAPFRPLAAPKAGDGHQAGASKLEAAVTEAWAGSTGKAGLAEREVCPDLGFTRPGTGAIFQNLSLLAEQRVGGEASGKEVGPAHRPYQSWMGGFGLHASTCDLALSSQHALQSLELRACSKRMRSLQTSLSLSGSLLSIKCSLAGHPHRLPAAPMQCTSIQHIQRTLCKP